MSASEGYVDLFGAEGVPPDLQAEVDADKPRMDSSRVMVHFDLSEGFDLTLEECGLGALDLPEGAGMDAITDAVKAALAGVSGYRDLELIPEWMDVSVSNAGRWGASWKQAW